MIQFKTDVTGKRRRVHKEYVDVYCRLGRDGRIEPVTVSWRDGRSFTIDELVEPSVCGADILGVRQERYRVRFGRHETDLYLERRSSNTPDTRPDESEPEKLRWWVYAYDETKRGPNASAPGVAG